MIFANLFVCLFNRSLRAETNLGPDGTRPERNVQARLKSLYKHAGELIYENVKTDTDLKIRDEGKEDHCHSQQIKLNNFGVSLWDKGKEILYPISTATAAAVLTCSTCPQTNTCQVIPKSELVLWVHHSL